MKRIAAQMVGGLITSTILTMITIQAVYLMWQGGKIGRERRDIVNE